MIEYFDHDDADHETADCADCVAESYRNGNIEWTRAAIRKHSDPAAFVLDVLDALAPGYDDNLRDQLDNLVNLLDR